MMSTTENTGTPRIELTEHGPYRVTGDVAICDTAGTVLRHGGSWCLCRCGGSRTKPFCDATHGRKGFDGSESADHGSTADRRESYDADGVTVYDDRSVCAHFGQCTNRLAAVFRAEAEPFVDPHGAPADQITDVVAGCPSGALSYAVGLDPRPVERDEPPSITPIVDGPYRVRGGVEVVGVDGRSYEVRARQTLCRCGQSRNKPFCDGSHWYAGFRDPLPPELAHPEPTVYEWLGGIEALEQLTTRFYEKINAERDPLLEPLFGNMDPNHPKHVAAWLAETFGGPPLYTEQHGGYEHMLAKHRDRELTEEQRQRWVSRMIAMLDEVGFPADPDFRSTFLAYLEWGTRIAVVNSAKGAAVMEHAPVPHWGWGQSPPFFPQEWDDPGAADRGRRRYAEEQARKAAGEQPAASTD
jgi:CDGSH-type Zn-finger protein/truncated hemoglobin YjbI